MIVPTNIDVSIIIVNYNTKDLLRDCLASIYEHTSGIAFEVIVSDNGSTDGSVEMIRAEFPRVIVIENNANLGFGAANNRAARLARGEFLLLLNSDATLENNAPRAFCGYAREHGLALLGGYLRDRAGNIIHSAERYAAPVKTLLRLSYNSFPLLLKAKRFFVKEKKIERRDGAAVDYITGADLFIEKALFRRLGGFDERFFMYFEDDDLCRRARALGVKAYLVSGPEITHFEGASSRNAAQKLMFWEKSFCVYARKHYPAPTRFFLKAACRVYALARFLSLRHSPTEKKALFTNLRGALREV